MRKLKNNELNRLNLEEFKNIQKTPLIIVLDNVRSANNVGSIFRTSDAFLIEKICLCGITPTPPHKEIRKIDIETGFTEVDKDLTEKFNVNGVTANLGNGVSFISSISSLNQQFEDEAAAASGDGGAGAT